MVLVFALIRPAVFCESSVSIFTLLIEFFKPLKGWTQGSLWKKQDIFGVQEQSSVIGNL